MAAQMMRHCASTYGGRSSTPTGGDVIMVRDTTDRDGLADAGHSAAMANQGEASADTATVMLDQAAGPVGLRGARMPVLHRRP
jgi:hypothetical protein